jgi:streptogramin lyase
VQTPTMANLGTLANLLAACVAQLKNKACPALFAAATAPTGDSPKNTLAATEYIVRYPSHNAAGVFGLLDSFYPLPTPGPGQLLRVTPFLPYLTFAPSAWVFPLKVTGGGMNGGGKLMFDAHGNAWVADNFIAGAQNNDAALTGGLSEFAPNGKPISPGPVGFTGGGISGTGFGVALDAHGNVWATSFTGSTISMFDNTGKPLSPPHGWNFNGKLGQMQGIIATPGGDIFALDTTNMQLVRFPQGDPSKAQFLCHNANGRLLENPCKLLGPFALAIDQQNRIWITNLFTDHVSRILASDPSQVAVFKAGYSASGLAVDSLGNVWITNKLGNSLRGHAKLLEAIAAYKLDVTGDPNAMERATKVLVRSWIAQTPGAYSGGSITVLRPDGKEAPFSPISGKGIATPWDVAVDGNDNIWISNLATSAYGIVELCGFRPQNCPPGVKTGDAISPPGGYVGGGLQMQVDVQIGPAGDVWATNNWDDWSSCYPPVPEALSTRCGGQGLVVFYGMAKPVKTPLIGPPRQP